MRRSDLQGLLVTAAAAGLATATFFGLLEGVRTGLLAEEIRIVVDGDADRVQVSGRDGRGILGGLEERQNGRSWIAHRRWANALYLHADADALAGIRSVTVHIGGRTSVWPHDDLLRTWKRVPTPGLYRSQTREVLTLEYPEATPTGFLHPGFFNWPGFPAAARWAARVPLICLALALIGAGVVRRWARRPESQAVIDRCLAAPASTAGDDGEVGIASGCGAGRAWFASGFAFVVLAIVWLEWAQPLYFTQDDNFSQFLPVILQSCAAVFGGHLPMWNPYQLYGAATLTLGTYALTYPGTYLAYVIARFLLGDERLTLEVFAVVHMLAGYGAAYWLLRQQKIRSTLASTGAVCFILSGFFLVGGRTWYYMFPVAVWVPLLFGLALKLVRGAFSWRATLIAGVILGVFFHAGNAQMWLYTILFLTAWAAIQAVGRTIPWRSAARLVPVFLLGAGIAAPLLLWQASETTDLDRQGGQGPSLAGGGLAHVLLPLGPLIRNKTWGGIDYQYVNEAYYCGAAFVLATALGLACLFALLVQRRRTQLLPLLADNVWPVLALVAFAYALGPAGVVWSVTALLPVFDKLNVPLKFMAFFNLFAILGGAVVCQRLLKNRPWVVNRIAFATLALAALHVLFARASFYSFGDRQYFGPPEAVRALVSQPAPQRVLPVAAVRSIRPGYTGSLALNFSTAAGLISAYGYDPLVEQSWANRCLRDWMLADPRAAAKALGISWLLVDPSAIDPPDTDDLEQRPVVNGTDQQFYHVFREQSDRVVEAGSVTLVHIPGSDPLAFVSSEPQHGLPVRWSTEGADADTSGLTAGETVTLNVLWRPWMRFRQGGRDLASTPDRFGRAVATLSYGGKPMTMRYVPPIRRPLLFGLTLILMAFGSAASIAGFQRAARPRAASDVEQVVAGNFRAQRPADRV